MAFLEYMLLTLLGSAGAASPGTPARTFTADALTQPSGGTEGLLGQAPGGDPDRPHNVAGTGRKGRYHLEAGRHHRRSHRRGKIATTGGSSVSSSTAGKGGVKPNMNAQPRPPRPRRASNSNKNSK
jgi:hypothetical protein